MKTVVVTGSFDDVRARQVRFLEEASKLGQTHVCLWSDATVYTLEGKYPRFPLEERLYVLQAIRYVNTVSVTTGPIRRDSLPALNGLRPDIWLVDERNATPQKEAYCKTHELTYRVVKDQELGGFPPVRSVESADRSARKKVVVTGCYDWFHSGHVRFFEEVSQLGDVYVVAGSDANVKLLKGEGHPLFSQAERRYMVQSVRYVTQAMISTGQGWMDAEPEIAAIKPDIYAVNEDGDKPEKREFCVAHGIEYVVLKRTPKEGLPRRQSTDLRGF
jgi:cytidyltransferase-like protein